MVDGPYQCLWALLPEATRRGLCLAGFRKELRRARNQAHSLVNSGALYIAAVGDLTGLQATVRALAARQGGGGKERARVLRALQACWDVVDEARAGAAIYWLLAVAVETAAAACGVGSVALAVMSGSSGGDPAAIVWVALMGLSALSALCGFASALGLGARGRRLTALAGGLESAVWRYRTRTRTCTDLELAACEARIRVYRELFLAPKLPQTPSLSLWSNTKEVDQSKVAKAMAKAAAMVAEEDEEEVVEEDDDDEKEEEEMDATAHTQPLGASSSRSLHELGVLILRGLKNTAKVAKDAAKDAAKRAAKKLCLPWLLGPRRVRYCHGQYRRPARRWRWVVGGLGGWRVVPVEGEGGGIEDDHYSRLSAADYVALRVRPAAAGFQRQLPALSAAWYAVSAALVAAAAAGTVLAHNGAASTVAILSAAAMAAATAARRRGGGREGVGRLNAAAGRLEALLAQWEAERGRLDVEDLVSAAEQVGGWMRGREGERGAKGASFKSRKGRYSAQGIQRFGIEACLCRRARHPPPPPLQFSAASAMSCEH